LSLLQNSVSFAEALAVSRQRTFGSQAAKHAFLSGRTFKTEILKEPRFIDNTALSYYTYSGMKKRRKDIFT
jgi:hypothetical protein